MRLHSRDLRLFLWILRNHVSISDNSLLIEELRNELCYVSDCSPKSWVNVRFIVGDFHLLTVISYWSLDPFSHILKNFRIWFRVMYVLVLPMAANSFECMPCYASSWFCGFISYHWNVDKGSEAIHSAMHNNILKISSSNYLHSVMQFFLSYQQWIIWKLQYFPLHIAPCKPENRGRRRDSHKT